MTSDAEDALSWEGDDERAPVRRAPRQKPAHAAERPAPEETPVLREGWNAVGKGSERVVHPGEAAALQPEGDEDADPAPMSTAMLLLVGVFAGVYLLYTVGWIIGGLNLKPLANLIVADAMYLPWYVLAIAAPALWMLMSWVLTRGRAAWVRVVALLAGAVLLVPWPFVMVGAFGS